MRYRSRPASSRSIAGPAVASPGKVFCFRLGFWFLLLSWGVMTLGKTRWEINSIWISAPLLIPGMLLLLFAALQDWMVRWRQLDEFQKWMLRLLVLWCVVTISRGAYDWIEYFMRKEGTLLLAKAPLEGGWITRIRDLVGIRYFGWAWLVPLLLFLGMDGDILRQMVHEMSRQNRVGLLVFLLCLLPPLSLLTDFNLNWGCSVLLIFWHYLPKPWRRFALAGAALGLFFNVIASSRNEVLGHGALLVAAAGIGMLRHGGDRFWRQGGILLLVCMTVGLGYYVVQVGGVPGLSGSVNARIQTFKEELNPDNLLKSRVSEGKDLYREFLDSMAGQLLLGRGAMGTYEAAGSKDNPEAAKNRQIVECGYLQIILKGGVLMLGLILAMVLPALWLGLFHSRNWFVRGFAAIVAAWLLEMVPFGLPAAFPRYLLFWMAIGVCLSPALRGMSDAEVEARVFGWKSPVLPPQPTRMNSRRRLGRRGRPVGDATPPVESFVPNNPPPGKPEGVA